MASLHAQVLYFISLTFRDEVQTKLLETRGGGSTSVNKKPRACLHADVRA